MDPVIETQGLTKIFKDFRGRPKQTALDNLSIRIAPGEVFGLIGPNGSGKTTTFKLLLGLLFPTSGTATVLGQPPTDVSAKKRLGFVPEESHLYRWLNADETLDFFGRLSGLDRATRRRRADELVERFGLVQARRRKLREYSKGMTRRVSFCQALLNDPDLLILDEPTSGLDPISSRQIKDLILDLRKRGKTVLLSSHLLSDVQHTCDRIAILHQGQTKLYGSVHDLLVRHDSVELTFKGLSEAGRKKIEDLARAEGAHLMHAENTQETLEAVFLRTVQESAQGASPATPQEKGRNPADNSPSTK
ncbi:MAG TPA: ABC transporter ATP-binding protein [Planctomycetota bacterium]|nr:ABC transporter ATP-binding protein [Planctomycetota bacterium]